MKSDKEDDLQKIEIHLKKDMPAGSDFSGQHEKIAEQLKRIVERVEENREFNLKNIEKRKNAPNKEEIKDRDLIQKIGLTGEWGSGKSSIIEILKTKLNPPKNENKDKASGETEEKYCFFEFDFWTHEKEPLRKAFVLGLLKTLEDNWGLEKADVINIKKEYLYKEENQRQEKYKAFGLWAFISLFIGLPSSIALKWPEISTYSTGQLVSTVIVLSVAAGILFAVLFFKTVELNSFSEAFRKIFCWWAIFETAQTEISKYSEPTLNDFKEIFGAIKKKIKDKRSEKKFIFVFDNIDRLELKHQEEVWTFIQTTLGILFPSNREPMFECAIVPFAVESFYKYETVKEITKTLPASEPFEQKIEKQITKPETIENKINKVFDCVINTPPFVFVKAKEFFIKTFNEIIEQGEERRRFKDEDIEKLSTFFFRVSKFVKDTPRGIIHYINEIGLLTDRHEGYTLTTLGAFVLAKKERTDFHDSILGGFLIEPEDRVYLEKEPEIIFASLYMTVDKKMAAYYWHEKLYILLCEDENFNVKGHKILNLNDTEFKTSITKFLCRVFQQNDSEKILPRIYALIEEKKLNDDVFLGDIYRKISEKIENTVSLPANKRTRECLDFFDKVLSNPLLRENQPKLAEKILEFISRAIDDSESGLWIPLWLKYFKKEDNSFFEKIISSTGEDRFIEKMRYEVNDEKASKFLAKKFKEIPDIREHANLIKFISSYHHFFDTLDNSKKKTIVDNFHLLQQMNGPRMSLALDIMNFTTGTRDDSLEPYDAFIEILKGKDFDTSEKYILLVEFFKNSLCFEKLVHHETFRDKERFFEFLILPIAVNTGGLNTPGVSQILLDLEKEKSFKLTLSKASEQLKINLPKNSTNLLSTILYLKKEWGEDFCDWDKVEDSILKSVDDIN